MSFVEVNQVKMDTSAVDTKTFYDEDGDLLPHVATEFFCAAGKEELLALPSEVLVDVILDSREVFTKATEIEYVAENLLGACMTALIQGDEILTRLFKNLTNNGKKNMSTEELQELLHGFVFAKSEELNALMMRDRML